MVTVKTIIITIIMMIALSAAANSASRNVYGYRPAHHNRNANLQDDALNRALDSERARLAESHDTRMAFAMIVSARQVTPVMLQAMNFKNSERSRSPLVMLQTRVVQVNGQVWDSYYVYDSFHLVKFERDVLIAPRYGKRTTAPRLR